MSTATSCPPPKKRYRNIDLNRSSKNIEATRNNMNKGLSAVSESSSSFSSFDSASSSRERPSSLVEQEDESGDRTENESENSCIRSQRNTSNSQQNDPSPSAPIQVRVRADGKKHVQKGSLDEETLIKAKIEASKGKAKDQMTEKERQEERRAANRLSAFQSRQRRHTVIEDLQKKVSMLSKENSVQRAEIYSLKGRLDSICEENEDLRSQIIALKKGNCLANAKPSDENISKSATPPKQESHPANMFEQKSLGRTPQEEQSVAVGLQKSSMLPSQVSPDTTDEALCLLQELATIQAKQSNLLCGKKRDISEISCQTSNNNGPQNNMVSGSPASLQNSGSTTNIELASSMDKGSTGNSNAAKSNQEQTLGSHAGLKPASSSQPIQLVPPPGQHAVIPLVQQPFQQPASATQQTMPTQLTAQQLFAHLTSLQTQTLIQSHPNQAQQNMSYQQDEKQKMASPGQLPKQLSPMQNILPAQHNQASLQQSVTPLNMSAHSQAPQMLHMTLPQNKVDHQQTPFPPAFQQQQQQQQQRSGPDFNYNNNASFTNMVPNQAAVSNQVHPNLAMMGNQATPNQAMTMNQNAPNQAFSLLQQQLNFLQMLQMKK